MINKVFTSAMQRQERDGETKELYVDHRHHPNDFIVNLSIFSSDITLYRRHSSYIILVQSIFCASLHLEFLQSDEFLSFAL